MTADRVVIVGAGLAGARCADTLRAEGYGGQILLVGEEPIAPYERPALSKELLAGVREPEHLGLRPQAFYAERGISLLLGRRVVAVDPERKTATLSGGHQLAWDALVLATGARARGLGLGTLPSGVHHLRTLADALRLREDVQPGSRLAIVGAGFVGAEVASTAAALGVHVTLIDLALPMQRAVGPEVASLLAARCVEHGIDLRVGAGVHGLTSTPEGRIRSVRLGDGSEVRCDAALVAVGAEPASEISPGAVHRDGGIVTDEAGRTSIPGVYACGDVAMTAHPLLRRPLRLEHWTSAAGQAAAVARTIVGMDAPYVAQPYFWSDQLGLRLQLVGHVDGSSEVELEGEPDSFVARYRGPDGAVVAVLAANRPAEIGALRRELGVGLLAPAA